eukprot:3041310-Rhodomonas_salina.2
MGSRCALCVSKARAEKRVAGAAAAGRVCGAGGEGAAGKGGRDRRGACARELPGPAARAAGGLQEHRRPRAPHPLPLLQARRRRVRLPRLPVSPRRPTQAQLLPGLHTPSAPFHAPAFFNLQIHGCVIAACVLGDGCWESAEDSRE